MNVELGSKVKDTVTGIVGLVTARCDYLFGEPRICIEWSSGEGEAKEMWLPVNRVRAVETA